MVSRYVMYVTHLCMMCNEHRFPLARASCKKQETKSSTSGPCLQAVGRLSVSLQIRSHRLSPSHSHCPDSGQYEAGGGTYGTLQIGHTIHEGHQRLQYWPFSDKTYYGFNREDFVFTRPPGVERFVLSPDNVWYGQLKLLFTPRLYPSIFMDRSSLLSSSEPTFQARAVRYDVMCSN